MNRDASKMQELAGTPHDLAWLCLKIEQAPSHASHVYIHYLPARQKFDTQFNQ